MVFSIFLKNLFFKLILINVLVYKKGLYINCYKPFHVPKTGFEPARRFQRYHLKVVRLPISPPGQPLRECKNRVSKDIYRDILPKTLSIGNVKKIHTFLN
jgi:hypothetical protein